MLIPASVGQEVQGLAEWFNHMLDRLALAFARQRDFVAVARHELRTPLTVISGQQEVLAAQDHSSPEGIRLVQRLVSAEIARTSRLVDDMLLLARSEQRDFLRRTTTDLLVFVTDLWHTTTARQQRRLDLGQVPSGTLSADPDRLAQALRNLIDNALAHTTAPDGRIDLKITLLSAGRVRFTVTDRCGEIVRRSVPGLLGDPGPRRRAKPPPADRRHRWLRGAGVTAAIAAAGCGGSLAQRTESGQAVFSRECSACHALLGRQSPRQQGGSLRGLTVPRAILLQFAAEMPVPHRLTRADRDVVVNYILSVQRQDRVRRPG